MRRLIAAAIVLAAASCSSGGSHTAPIHQSDFGDDWPLTVASGDLECKDGAILFTAPDGQTYAVNGTARDLTDAADITPIWRPTDYGLRANLAPLIDRGIALC